MKRLLLRALLVVLVSLVVLAGVIVFNASRLHSKQPAPAPVTDIQIDSKVAAEHLAGAIKFQTVSFQDPALFKADEFLGLHAYIENTFPKTHAALTKEVVADHSLLYTWKGRNPGLKPILLIAHLDVVPAETGGGWAHNPFGGHIVDGFVWGRGSWDDKASATAILEAVEYLVGKGFQPERTVMIAFGHDEEVGGKNGAVRIAALLKSRNVELESVLDEGGSLVNGMVPGIAKPVALIGIAEKGYMSLELTVAQDGGHSSMPPPHTAVGILSAAVARIENDPFPARFEGPTREMFEYLGPEMPFGTRMVFANPRLFKPFIVSRLEANPGTNAGIRTTAAVTIFQGGVKDNVLPQSARAVVNFRILPGTTIEQVVNHVRQAVNDPRITLSVDAKFASEASAVSDTRAESFRTLCQAVADVFPDAVVAPYLVVGGTDSRHYQSVCANIHRFLPVRVGRDDLPRFHGTNERISVGNFAECVTFYAHYIRVAAGKRDKS